MCRERRSFHRPIALQRAMGGVDHSRLSQPSTLARRSWPAPLLRLHRAAPSDVAVDATSSEINFRVQAIEDSDHISRLPPNDGVDGSAAFKLRMRRVKP